MRERVQIIEGRNYKLSQALSSAVKLAMDSQDLGTVAF